MSTSRDVAQFNRMRAQLSDWFSQPLGRTLQVLESRRIAEIVSDVFGYYIVQVRCPGWREDALGGSRIRSRVTMDLATDPAGSGQDVLGMPDAVPFRTDSVDSLVLIHSLEFEQDPHQVLREAERILVPEGRLIVVGFNPRSFWGMWRFLLKRSGNAPWCGRFLSQARLRDWLSLLGFDVQSTQMLFSRPPIQGERLLDRLEFMDRLGARWCPFFSAAYVLVATKRVSTLTSVRTPWRSGRKLMGGGVVEPTTRNHGIG